jgi:hypothetical protein
VANGLYFERVGNDADGGDPMATDRKGLSNGQGRLNTDERGGLSIMRTPFARMPLKNDVAVGEAAPSPRSKDPLDYFPAGTREDR